jgi:His-Xaa-Ser repeat protein HxsA
MKPKTPRPSTSSPHGTASTPGGAREDADAPRLNNGEKLRLQVLRVQIALKRTGLYEGAVNGIFNAETREALSHFQTVKGLPASGMMTTPTLNALGVPAVN